MAAAVREIYVMVFVWRRILAASTAIIIALLFTPSLHAQTIPKLPIAWAPLHPLIYEGQNGEVAGFMVDLAKGLGREVGFEPEFFRSAAFPEWREAQRTGASVLLLGGAKPLPFQQTNVFSDQIFEAEVRLAVRFGEEDKIDLSNVARLRIGTIRPGAGSNPALYPDAQMIDYASVNAALFALLAGDIDAISTTTLFVYSAARNAGLDHRIAFVGAPILQSDQYVAIHESHAELLDPINAALARMKADGRLQALLAKHNVVLPAVAPDVLTVGVTDFPPYSVHNDDGTFSGFAVDTFTDLADLAGLRIRYEVISDAEFGAGPSEETYDILIQAGVNAARAETMDFTLAVDRFAVAIFTRSGQAAGLSDLDSLVGRTVGVEAVNLGRRLAEGHGGLTIRVFDGRPALLQALNDGAVDAILFSSGPMNREIDAQGLTDEVEEVRPPIHISTRAPALRRGLGAVRQRLNAVIPRYLISDEYATLRDKWFGVPVFWTPGRVNLTLGAIGTAFLLLLGFIIWQRQRQRRRDFDQQERDLAREKTHSEELGKLVSELERSNRDLDEFAYIASHDMKEPLRGIGINVNFLLREELPQKARERAQRMLHLTGRMEQLISDLLFLSRLGRGDPSPVTVQPSQILEGIRSDLKEWLDEAGGEIAEVGEIPAIKGQRVQVKTILQNLIVNGIKYNDADVKRVEVGFLRQVEVNGKTLINAIFVRDNGIGIDDKYREKIFRIFSRLNKVAEYVTGSGTGTGSGLAFLRKIVEEHGGVVVFDAEPSGGSIFYVTLPMAD